MKYLIKILIPFTIFVILNSQDICKIPEDHVMNLFAIEQGKSTYLSIKESTIQQNKYDVDATCYGIKNTTKKLKNSLTDIEVIYKNRTNNCYFCFRLIRRSPLVMQYIKSGCKSDPKTICAGLEDLTTMVTGFEKSRKQKPLFNCKSIIEGVYDFKYKFTGYSGECEAPTNIVKACQNQGSPLRDNFVFTMNFDFCSSINPEKSKGTIQSVPYKYTWSCYGRWVSHDETVWSALQYNENEEKFRYRCMATRIDQADPNKQTWGLSVSADCNSLGTQDLQSAPIRLELKPAIDPDISIDLLEPGCKLPMNFTGEWFYPSEYHTLVKINSTHIYYKRKMSQDWFEEIYFVCIQYQEQRYLMATVTKGKCYLDYTCFHFLPRHHNIIRFRMGRPFRINQQFSGRPQTDSLLRTFREACHWNSFTLNYVDWVYEYYILNPPEPVNCPIQGRFKFKQEGDPQELYFTKIPLGMTPRPRLKVDCKGKLEPDFTACFDNPKMFRLDVSRCMRLDFTGRPISEYDTPDNSLTCVGYWMEDTKSFLITYDPEDPVNQNFRCWVYRRLDLNNFVMSRSQGTHCSQFQNAYSTNHKEGASLRLELTQNELEFDVCPMKFDNGADPYQLSNIMHVFASANRINHSITFLIFMIFVSFLGLLI